ncbi:MAG: hypothetical protein ABI840_12680 [bacterium]
MKKLILFVLVLLFLATTFSSKPFITGWYQQFLPPIDNKPIATIYFLDSLNGFAGTDEFSNDTNYILKTTNSGNNWFIVHNQIKFFKEFSFINSTTGYVCGSLILKTTNSGNNWFEISFPLGKKADDMQILNEDTILFADENGFDGGVYRTTNAGATWQNVFNGGPNNPNIIYMYDKNLGFISSINNTFYRTTNAGVTWTYIPGVTPFTDMHFINSNTGWKCNGDFYKTTNGGLNWINIMLPPKNDSLLLSRINRFSVVNEDTIWGIGSLKLLGVSQLRGVIFATTDGGNTWGYQLPDTSINSTDYRTIFLINKNNIWAYWNKGGVHTTTGGDSTILLDIKQTSYELPDEFKLQQNYPNPFNPTTLIKFKIAKHSFVILKVYNIKGEEI